MKTPSITPPAVAPFISAKLAFMKSAVAAVKRGEDERDADGDLADDHEHGEGLVVLDDDVLQEVAVRRRDVVPAEGAADHLHEAVAADPALAELVRGLVEEEGAHHDACYEQRPRNDAYGHAMGSACVGHHES